MRTHVYTVTVNSNMFQGPHHSKASGLDTYNIYGCLQHLAEASHRDWWVGSAYCTPFWCHFVSRGRLLFSAVASCRISEELHSEICREKRTRPFIWGLHFLLWLPFWTPFRCNINIYIYYIILYHIISYHIILYYIYYILYIIYYIYEIYIYILYDKLYIIYIIYIIY